MNRRDFLVATSAVAGGSAAATGTAAAQQSGGNASGGGGGGSETVAVGSGSGLSFDPEELTIAPGTTVTWEWTGQGGAHNVVADDGAFNSGPPEDGDDITFSHTFPEAGEFPYHCAPHEGVGMVGTVIVQEGGSSASAAATEVDPEEMGVPIQAHFVGIATLLMMAVSLVYTFFVVKYGESPNAKRGS
ncbi:plastocyanin/azurin family copper-binding protein [Halococcus hamelinensis]|uniref:Halocyanin n=1 Tax=Halococcus hamelinensis 100A6 TaxID=1132509 RepID=M0M1L3_9EURY|nr:plastocyanin/azurin family copper-binding protein [Halococcus hamelinensis]EMA39303.1 halocyanin [Halococcus hamelinensis 100A6]